MSCGTNRGSRSAHLKARETQSSTPCRTYRAAPNACSAQAATVFIWSGAVPAAYAAWTCSTVTSRRLISRDATPIRYPARTPGTVRPIAGSGQRVIADGSTSCDRTKSSLLTKAQRDDLNWKFCWRSEYLGEDRQLHEALA